MRPGSLVSLALGTALVLTSCGRPEEPATVTSHEAALPYGLPLGTGSSSFALAPQTLVAGTACGITQGIPDAASAVKAIWGCVAYQGYANIQLGHLNQNVAFQYAKLFETQHPEYFIGPTSMQGGVLNGNTLVTFLISPSDRNLVKTAANDAYQATRSIVAGTTNLPSRVRQIHDYIGHRTHYDWFNYKNHTIPLVSYSAYGPLQLGVAVCEGYAAAFNFMAFYAGVSSTAVAGSTDGSWKKGDHAWNKIDLNNQILYVDVTFDDPVNQSTGQTLPTQQTYDMVSAQKLGQDHSWNDADYQPGYFNGVHQ